MELEHWPNLPSALLLQSPPLQKSHPKFPTPHKIRTPPDGSHHGPLLSPPARHGDPRRLPRGPVGRRRGAGRRHHRARHPAPLPGRLGRSRRFRRDGDPPRLRLQVRRAAAGLLLHVVQGDQDRRGPQAPRRRGLQGGRPAQLVREPGISVIGDVRRDILKLTSNQRIPAKIYSLLCIRAQLPRVRRVLSVYYYHFCRTCPEQLV